MQYTIQVPKPCDESWDAMTPEDNGRHCAQCCKTVVDFTSWSQEDILSYIRQRGSAGVCGRFRREQLNVPITAEQFTIAVVRSPLPMYKKLTAILLFALGILQVSCDNETKPQHPVSQVAQPTDTLKTEQRTLGIVSPPASSKQDTAHKAKHKKYKPVDRNVMGGAMPVMEPPQPEDHLTGVSIAEPAIYRDSSKASPIKKP